MDYLLHQKSWSKLVWGAKQLIQHQCICRKENVLIVVGGKKYPTSIWWHPSTAHANDFAIFQAQFACRNSGVPNALRVQFTLFWSLHVKFTIDRCFFSTMMAWGSCSWWFAQTFKNNVLTTQPYAHLKQQQQ